MTQLPPEPSKRQQDPSEVISFSQSTSVAVNKVPNTQLNPFAKKLSMSWNVGFGRKHHFCKKCGHYVLLTDALIPVCPNPSCGYLVPKT